MTPGSVDAVTSTALGRVSVLTVNRPDARNAINSDVSETIGALLAWRRRV
jgi:enoyl-CoA hydratase/carnithine racemase